MTFDTARRCGKCWSIKCTCMHVIKNHSSLLRKILTDHKLTSMCTTLVLWPIGLLHHIFDSHTMMYDSDLPTIMDVEGSE